MVVLSNVLMKSLLNSVLNKDGGLYKPDISHFLLSILSSMYIDSTFWNSKFTLCHKLGLTWYTLSSLLRVVSCLLAMKIKAIYSKLCVCESLIYFCFS